MLVLLPSYLIDNVFLSFSEKLLTFQPLQGLSYLDAILFCGHRSPLLQHLLASLEYSPRNEVCGVVPHGIQFLHDTHDLPIHPSHHEG